MQLLTSLRAKLDIYKLEQRYTRRDKRTTFTSGAQYVDGEYIYAHNNNSNNGSSSRNLSGRPAASPLGGSTSSMSFGSVKTKGSTGSGGLKGLGKRASRLFA